MKHLKDFILEAKEDNDVVFTVYDKNDNTIVNVFDTEDEAKKAAEEYEKQGEMFTTEIKKEKRNTVEKD